MSYCTVQNVKDYLVIIGTTDDTLLSTLIGQAQAFLESNTNRRFNGTELGDTTRYFDIWQDIASSRYVGHRAPWYADATSQMGGRVLPERIGGYGWPRTLYLDEDLCAITTIVNGDGTTVASDKYVTEPRNQTPWFALTLKESSGIVWTTNGDVENAVSITGKWAYALTPPSDVVMATIELTAYLYRRRGAESPNDQPQVSPSGVTLFPAKFPATVQSVIKRYQKLGGV